MKPVSRTLGLWLTAAITCLTGSPAVADWPGYRNDATRAAISTEPLQFPMGTAWVRHSPQPPQPAWPEDGRSFSVFDFDYAFVPVVADGILYYGSSADDSVYALDARDGSLLWTFTTGAPVRFAPHIAEGRCFFASDDGMIYALDALTGRLIWEFQAAPQNRMLVGNRRLISRWPCRSGVLVHEGTLYAVAGMWPTVGVNVYALDAVSGEMKWINDTMNGLYIPYPHDGLALGGPTAQGYLATDGEVLVMPTGESSPAVMNAKTGELMHWEARAGGSTWVALVDGFVASPARGWQPNQPTRLGEAELFRGDGLAFIGATDGNTSFGKWGRYDALGGVREGHNRWRGQIAPIGGRNRIAFTGDRFFASGMGELEAIDSSGDPLNRLWKVSHPRTYSLAAASNVVLTGSDGFVVAVDIDSGETVWRGEVNGQARELAVADGMIFAATDQGAIHAFAPGLPSQPAARRTIVEAGQPKGFALVIGADDTELAEQIAEAEPTLQVVALLADRTAVREARTRLLQAGRYGRHIVVHAAPEDGSLPYSDYFANQVVVVRGGGGIRAGEIYRVLRPIGGRLSFEDTDTAQIEQFIRAAGVADSERQGALIERGPLDGAFDWNSGNEVDQRVKWPLELHWFGGPGRERTLSRHNKNLPPPVPAAGRIYSLGDGYVTAMDAYTGLELWSHHAPGYRHVSADDQHAYIGMGSHVMQLDARTGRLLGIYGQANHQVHSLTGPLKFDAFSDDQSHGGGITISRTDHALELKLTTITPATDDKDAWTLWFDFRPGSDRLSPPALGSFPIVVDIKRGQLRRVDGFADTSIPAVELRRDNDHLMLTIGWDEIRKLTGDVPPDFDLSVELDLFEAGEFRRLFNHNFLTERRDPWRRGTSTLVLNGEAGQEASPFYQVEQIDRDTLPGHAREWGRTPLAERHDGNQPRMPLFSEQFPRSPDRINPFTGERGEMFYLRGYGCSGTAASATMNFFRSGTLGMYDLVDDSGMRNFPGVRPGCRITISPSMGVVIYTEATGDCFCPYNFSTNLGFAPAAERSNEDWAVFKDKARVGQMRQLGLNFGAPGDRRDDKGLLWMGYPRQPAMFLTGASFGEFPQTISLPIDVRMAANAGPYRVNADRVSIANTSTPWVTASGLEGIRQLTLGLIYHEPMTTALASPLAAGAAPAIDGHLDDAAWEGDTGLPLTTDPGGISNEGRVRVRYGDDNVYLGFRQDAVFDRRGRPLPWDGSHFDVLLKDSQRAAYAHFHIKADGVMTSEAMSSVVSLPRMARPTIDAGPEDWQDAGLTLDLGDQHGHMRIATTGQGLALWMELPLDTDESGRRLQFANLDNERIVEAVIDIDKGTAEIVRVMIDGGSGTADSSVFDELQSSPRRRALNELRDAEPIATDVAVRKDNGKLVVEAMIPLDHLQFDGGSEPSIAMQLSAFDPSHSDGNITSGSGARRDMLVSGSLLSLVPTDEPVIGGAASVAVTTANRSRQFYGHLWSFNASRQSIATDRWSAAVVAGNFLGVEIAIPIATINDAGLSLHRLQAQFMTAGSMPPDLDQLHRQFSARSVRVHTDEVPVEPLRYTLRLHFAEVNEDARAGERVFDINIQGRSAARGVDIVRDADGPQRALTLDFTVSAERELDIEFVPHAGEPLLSGIELISTP